MTQPYRIQMHETGGPDVLKVEDFIPRKPGPGEVTVRQSAAGLNFIDTYHRTGLYPVRFPFTPGQEGAGAVQEVGEGVTHLKPGDKVAYLGSGTYASHFTGPADRMLLLPDDIRPQDAAAVLLTGLTAWALLFEVRFRPGRRFSSGRPSAVSAACSCHGPPALARASSPSPPLRPRPKRQRRSARQT